MRLWIVALLIIIFPFSATADPGPVSLYGSKIEFDVIREGKIVGEHKTSFDREDGKLVIKSHMMLKIYVLMFPIYTFSYVSTEIWRENLLSKLNVKVNDGGESTEINANVEGDEIVVDGPNGRARAKVPIFSSNHWNADVVNSNVVLNTLTGRINSIKVLRREEERVALSEGSVRAVRYDYSGEIEDTSVWYDPQGRWVKLMFKARDGSTIEYICKTCESD